VYTPYAFDLSRTHVNRGFRGFKLHKEVEYKVPEGDDPQYNYTSWFMIRAPTPPGPQK
jgi:hypothetical protein